MCVLNPHVHVLGDDAAVIAYTTLTQHLDKSVLCCAAHLLVTVYCVSKKCSNVPELRWVVSCAFRNKFHTLFSSG